jgi:hypothetical protein
MVAMVCLYQTCAETDLATLHYVTFIEPYHLTVTKSQ